MLTYESLDEEEGYNKIIAEDMKKPKFDPKNISNAEFLWMFAKHSIFCNIISGYNGFMASLTNSMTNEKTTIIPLPILNAPASKLDTMPNQDTYMRKLWQNI